MISRTFALALGALALATVAAAQSTAAASAAGPYDDILAALPATQRAAATVIKWKADFTYETLKQGTNRLVCYDQSGWPLQYAYSIECTSIANLPRVAQNYKFEAVGDRPKRNALVAEAEKNGTRVKPEYGSIWYHLYGPDKEHQLRHATVALPDATAASTGLAVSAAGGGAWLMDAGTSGAHLMLPGE